MKKTNLLLIFFTIFLSVAFSGTKADAEEGLGAAHACEGHTLGTVNGCPACMEGENLHICENNFPDASFRSYLRYNLFREDKVSVEQTNNLTTLVCWSKKIASLRGIEYFGALEELDCSNNQLMNLDTSQNIALKRLFCGANQLTSLNISQNAMLEELGCSNNQLMNLDTSQNIALKRLFCGSNQLTSLDVSQNAVLKSLDCSSNKLTKLDVDGCTALSSLHSSNNKLSYLDISSCAALDNLSVSGNQLNSIRISNCPKLILAVEMGEKYNPVNSDDCSYIFDIKEIQFDYSHFNNDLPIQRKDIYYDSVYSLRLYCDKDTELIYSQDDYDLKKYSYITDKDRNGCYITYVDKSMVGANEVIPENIDGLPVLGLIGALYKNCMQLETVSIPRSITYIGEERNGSFCELFYGCYNLKRIDYSGTEAEWRNINIGEYKSGERESGPYLYSLEKLEGENKWVVYHPLQTSLYCSDTVRRSDGVNPKLRYSVVNGKIRIVGSGSAWEKELVIPPEIDSLPVSELDYFALDRMDFTKVTLPGTLGMREYNSDFGALTNCENLETIIFESETSENSTNLDHRFSASRLVFHGKRSLLIGYSYPYNQRELFLPANLSEVKGAYSDLSGVQYLSRIYYAGTRDDWSAKVSLSGNGDFSQVEMHYLQSIDFITHPEKRTYRKGENLDVTGALMLFTYDDGTQETFPIEAFMLSGFDPMQLGEQTVTVSSGSISASFVVQVGKRDYGASQACEGHTLGTVNGCPACMDGENLHICENNFPDESFRGCFSHEPDGYFTPERLNQIGYVHVKTGEIRNLYGIEFFSEITSLYCAGNQLTELDVSKNTKLTTLNCSEQYVIVKIIAPGQVDLSGLIPIEKMNLVTIQEGGILDASTGLVSLEEGTNQIIYSYDTGNAAVGPMSVVVTLEESEEGSEPDRTPGDLNGDGKVSGRDVLALLKHLTGADVEIVPGSLDINGDGKVGGRDVLLLLRYLTDNSIVIH